MQTDRWTQSASSPWPHQPSSEPGALWFPPGPHLFKAGQVVLNLPSCGGGAPRVQMGESQAQPLPEQDWSACPYPHPLGLVPHGAQEEKTAPCSLHLCPDALKTTGQRQAGSGWGAQGEKTREKNVHARSTLGGQPRETGAHPSSRDLLATVTKRQGSDCNPGAKGWPWRSCRR